MKICYIVPYFPPIQGGYSRHFEEYSILSRRGHEIFVITTKTKGMLRQEEKEGLKIFRVPTFFIPKIKYPIPNLLRLSRIILKLHQKFRFDVISFCRHQFLTTLPVIYLKKTLSVPIAITSGTFTGINWFYPNKLVNYVGKILSLTMNKLVMKKADKIRILSRDLIPIMSKMKIKRDKIKLIPHGIDTNKFKPYVVNRKGSGLSVENNDLVYIFIGRIDPIKGLNYLFDIFINLLKKKNNLKLFIVGEGYLLKKYRKMYKNYQDNIFFLGYRKDVPDLLNLSDIFILPSISEYCPAVIMEAGSCGLPVIASRVGAINEIIIDKKTGILINPKNKKELSSAMLYLLKNEEIREKMGQMARKRIIKNYEINNVVNNLENYYLSLIENSWVTKD